MTHTRRPTARLPQVLPLALVLATALPPAAAADSVAGQFGEWAGTTTVTRSMTLRELGFKQPLVLSGQESQREIYLPVPAGVATHDAQLQVDARYVRGHTGRSASLLSIDGDPVSARSITDAQGDLSQLIGIDGFARPNGFVRFGVGWWSVVSEYRCADQSAPANVLRLSPESRFSYRFDGRAIDTVAKAWGGLPATVRLLVEGRASSVQSYDTAWRVGTALENGGKRVDVVALPAVGAIVDLRGLAIPASLAGIPAYAALSDRSASHRIGSLAEVGALLSLRDGSPLAVDVAVLSDPLRAGVRAALDALGTQVASAAPDAAGAFAAWRKADMAGFEQPVGIASVQVALVGGHPTLLVASGAGAKVAGLLTQQWRAYAQGRALRVSTALLPPADKNVVLLGRLGDLAGTQDIVSRGDRTADLGALSSEGRLPSEVVVDVSAAPNPAGQGAVASIFFNDYLLGAKVLDADGKPQRLVATVPSYALAARNQVRISFLRQPARPYCHDPATGYPVSVLPSSHIRLADRSLAADFVGAASQLAGAHEVFVPSSWLQDAPASLTKVIHLAGATGASPMQAVLKVGAANTAIAPTGPYLSFVLAPQGLAQSGAVRDGKLVVSGPGNQVLLDLAGLDRAALVEVVGSGASTGVIYRELGTQGPQIAEPFRLIRGNLALLDANGVVQDFDGQDPTGARMAEQSNPQPLWQQHMVVLVVLVGVIVFMLLAARVVQIRRRRRAAQNGN
ncbi:hypothetical protein [Xanthomonas translucens]|uniref:hypothetical protein n=1 Tax=Xanthomonas campestris pv. translucens TaxID=343 RepID=UPI00071E7C64|nr:hypothetical protein [Xanthomonas translucens]QEN94779.1 hypothetical protein F0H33_16655 [Xanthomonas translucens pv. undulosa]